MQVLERAPATYERMRVEIAALPRDEHWNGYSLNYLVGGLNPIFKPLYFQFIHQEQTDEHHALAGTAELHIDKDTAPSFDHALETWGKEMGRDDKTVGEFKVELIKGNEQDTWNHQQDALVVQSKDGVAIALFALVINGPTHGAGRYGAIYIPRISKAAVEEHGAPSSAMRAAILIRAAQTAYNQDARPIPHFKYLPSNNK